VCTTLTNEDQNLSAEKLESASGQPLPDREAMSILPIDAGGGPLPLPIAGAEGDGGGNTPAGRAARRELDARDPRQ
jgi:hypothetical protein